MKPKNFPARKNQRRITALNNANYSGKNQSMVSDLEKKIINTEEARAIRTKKKRS